MVNMSAMPLKISESGKYYEGSLLLVRSRRPLSKVQTTTLAGTWRKSRLNYKQPS